MTAERQLDKETHPNWQAACLQTIHSYRGMIDGITEQLSDEELILRPAPEMNSVAVILRHLGGNLKSRWVDYRTTDGEKPTRDRDAEFQDWPGDRNSLMEYFEEGWSALVKAITEVDKEALSLAIYIRGEAHSIPEAAIRSVTHISYHVGQMAMIARMAHTGNWNWLTIAPGSSQQHNAATWGTSASRSVFGKQSEDTRDKKPD